MSTEKKNRPSDMTAEDHAALSAAGERYNNATTDEERVAAHADAEAIRNKYNYSGGADGSGYTKTNRSEADARLKSYLDVSEVATKAGNTGLAKAADSALKNSLAAQQPVQPAPYPGVSTPDFTGLLDSWLANAKAQQSGAIDYAVNKGVADLQRAEADAQEQFQTQQDQVSEDEAKALDNQALYAEARGDKGGIGQAQYGQIQATALQNRRAINTARTKLTTDTARQINDLRAQGEFKKADAILDLTQTYLGQLMELQQWGMEYALNVEQFNTQIDQWWAEFNMAAKEFDYKVSQNDQAKLADGALAALAVGIRPSANQQAALGYTDEQIDAMLAQYKLAQANGTKVTGSPAADTDPLRTMLAAGVVPDNALAYLAGTGKYAEWAATALADSYALNYEQLKEEQAWQNATWDWSSLKALGYGNKSEEEINAALDAKKIEAYRDGNVIRFRKTIQSIASDVANSSPVGKFKPIL